MPSSWTTYLQSNEAVPKEFFRRPLPRHCFKKNQFLEAVCGFGSNEIRVARITRVVGHLLRVRFEGRPSNYECFFDVSSPDLYPVGWCDGVGHSLVTPFSHLSANS